MQIILVKNIHQGIEKAKKELYKRVDNTTVLFLSGGKTPKPLYEVLVKEKKLTPAAAALIDERYGGPLHENSNEKMIDETGLLSYFKSKGIPFYGILPGSRFTVHGSLKDRSTMNNKQTNHELEMQKVAQEYNQTVRELLFHFPKSIGILGIGADGHTAGLPTRNSKLYETHDLVVCYTDTTGTYGQRITLTFSALSLLDFLIVFVFGKDKKIALHKTFEKGSLDEIPARFYQKPEISEKTLVITDQRV